MPSFNTATDRTLPGGIGTVVVTILAQNLNRHYVIMQNNSGVNIGISLSGENPEFDSHGNGVAGTIVLQPGAVYIIDVFPAPTNGMNAVAASGSGNVLTIIEW